MLRFRTDDDGLKCIDTEEPLLICKPGFDVKLLKRPNEHVYIELVPWKSEFVGRRAVEIKPSFLYCCETGDYEILTKLADRGFAMHPFVSVKVVQFIQQEYYRLIGFELTNV